MTNFENKINSIKAYTDEEICNFTGNKQIIIEKIRQGYKVSDIARYLGCSKQNVYSLIDSIVGSKLQGRQKSSRKPRTLNKTHNFDSYTDFSALSKREFQIVSLLIENPSMGYAEIGKKLGISANTVRTLRCRASKKLSGQWDEYREKINNHQKEYRKRHQEEEKERNKRYYDNNRDRLINGMKEYNKEYYRKNKERILGNRATRGQ